jgi:CTP synthase (UTP-ammonia lyase)
VEIARHVLGIEDADHEEYGRGGARSLVINALACSLVGQEHPVQIAPGTLAGRLYGVPQAVEPYYCNYGLNPAYRDRLAGAGLTVSGTGPEGEVRIVELTTHPFFLATLFVPQARSAAGRPHPVIAGLVAAATSAPRNRVRR